MKKVTSVVIMHQDLVAVYHYLKKIATTSMILVTQMMHLEVQMMSLVTQMVHLVTLNHLIVQHKQQRLATLD